MLEEARAKTSFRAWYTLELLGYFQWQSHPFLYLFENTVEFFLFFDCHRKDTDGKIFLSARVDAVVA
jgi:hypothetical protein